MSNEQIKCPECGHEFSLSKAMSKDIERDLRSKLEKELTTKIRSEASQEANVLRADLASVEGKLQQAQNAEVALRRQQRELEEKTRSLQLEVERKLDQERATIREKALRDADEAHRTKDAEKDKRLADALAQAAELQRKIEQGSQQNQGEALEIQVEEFLRKAFVHDTISEVAKGVKGGDIVQDVTTKTGVYCGRILWELKNTKNFSETWIPKLKEDGRNAKADILILISTALPEGVVGHGDVNGIWVTSPQMAMPLAAVLRKALIMAAKERASHEGMRSKAETVYAYVTGNEFKGRIEAIIEAFKGMKEDLDSERRAFDKIWAKREKQIAQVLTHIAGMHGDLEAIGQDEIKQVSSLTLKP